MGRESPHRGRFSAGREPCFRENGRTSERLNPTHRALGSESYPQGESLWITQICLWITQPKINFGNALTRANENVDTFGARCRHLENREVSTQVSTHPPLSEGDLGDVDTCATFSSRLLTERE